jgi:hypothetical protein
VNAPWHDFAALWTWALDEGGVLPPVLAGIITVGLLTLVAAAAYYLAVGVRRLGWVVWSRRPPRRDAGP